LNILQILFAWTFSPSSIPMILSLVLHVAFIGLELFEQQFFNFSFNLYFIFEFWDSVFYLF
jgi:hypothetical protein